MKTCAHGHDYIRCHDNVAKMVYGNVRARSATEHFSEETHFRAWRFDKSGLRSTLITCDLYHTLHYRARCELRNARRSHVSLCLGAFAYVRTYPGWMSMTRKKATKAARSVKFALNANPREQQVQEKKGDRAEGEALREELPYVGDAVLEEYSAVRASQRKRDAKERERGRKRAKVGEKSKWMGRR